MKREGTFRPFAFKKEASLCGISSWFWPIVSIVPVLLFFQFKHCLRSLSHLLHFVLHQKIQEQIYTHAAGGSLVLGTDKVLTLSFPAVRNGANQLSFLTVPDICSLCSHCVCYTICCSIYDLFESQTIIMFFTHLSSKTWNIEQIQPTGKLVYLPSVVLRCTIIHIPFLLLIYFKITLGPASGIHQPRWSNLVYFKFSSCPFQNLELQVLAQM